MTGQDSDHQRGRLRIDEAELRERLSAVAASIACTEDQVAETLERMALALPHDAVRLRAHAAQARHNATAERGRAAMYRHPG